MKAHNCSKYFLLGVLLLYLGCNLVEAEKLKVFVVPHSHCDPGWWKTFEGYYQQWTKGIIDSVISALAEDDRRTFIWTEISFFQRWWSDQNAVTQQKARLLAQSGRLEFVTGGWVANDEANTHFSDIILQLTEGSEWLQQNVGVKPVVSWSIDPFGHSPTMGWVLSQAGYNAMVINRVHQNTKASFRQSKKLEFIWRQNYQHDVTPTYDMMTHMLAYPLYDIPNTCGPDWDTCASFDFERDVATQITTQNVKKRSTDLLNQYKQKAANFQHNILLVPLGDDFKYKTLTMTTKIWDNYQMLFDHINSDPSTNVEIQFGTLSDYISAVQNTQLSFPVYHGDFFTYNDKAEDYWSGYFTTRPHVKALSRKASYAVKEAESLMALVAATKLNDGTRSTSSFPVSITDTVWSSSVNNMESARRNIGLFQHHDGITGTARVAVVQDYISRLEGAYSNAKTAAVAMLKVLLPQTGDGSMLSTLEANEDGKLLDLSKGDYVIVVHNSLGKRRAEIVHLVVSTPDAAVYSKSTPGQDATTPVTAQLSPVWSPNPGKPEASKFRLSFMADVAALGTSTYFVSRESGLVQPSRVNVFGIDGAESGSTFVVDYQKAASSISIENDELKLDIDPSTGLLSTAVLKESSTLIELNQSYQIYKTHRSGAYLFAPDNEAGLLSTGQPVVHVVQGILFDEATVYYSSQRTVSYQVRLYKYQMKTQDSVMEITHNIDLTGSFSDEELITRFSTNLQNGGAFYTDSNGIDIQKRKYDINCNIPCNFYPITSTFVIQDEDKDTPTTLTVLTKQAFGASSLKEGQFEIMLDRKLQRDDGRGLGEGVTDSVAHSTTMWFMFEQSASPRKIVDSPTAYGMSLKLNHPVGVFHNKITDKDSYSANYHLQLAPIAENSVGKDIDLFGFKPRPSNMEEVVLQLLNPSPTESMVADIPHLLSAFTIESLQEYSLTLIHEKGPSSRLDFKAGTTKSYRLEPPSMYQGIEAPHMEDEYVDPMSGAIYVQPKEIRTFVLRLKPFGVNAQEQQQTPYKENKRDDVPPQIPVTQTDPTPQPAGFPWLLFGVSAAMLLAIIFQTFRQRVANKYLKATLPKTQ